MWKIVLGFIVFASLAMFVIIKGGDNVDMSGESHSIESHEEKPAVPAVVEPAPATEPAPAAEPAPATEPTTAGDSSVAPAPAEPAK